MSAASQSEVVTSLSACPIARGEANSLSISTYNVLMPNSVDGWWIYKYYQPEVPEEDRTWPKRQALMRSKLLGPDGKSGADVICIQEACADSFEDDFAFMSEAGYAHLLHTKFRLRVATFWNTARVALAEEGAHKSLDRTLCAALRLTGRPDASPVYVANAHLTGGPNPDKRLRQAHDALEWIRKDVAKRAGVAGKGGKSGAPAEPAAPAVFFCGDLNDEGASAVRVLLEQGEVPAGFAQDGVEVTSKPKKQAFGAFRDAYADAYAARDEPPPPTLRAAELESLFIAPRSAPAPAPAPGDAPEDGAEKRLGEDLALTPALEEALRGAFEALSSGKDAMDQGDVDKWLVAINRKLGRGSEFRAAAALLERRAAAPPRFLLQDFVQVYKEELAQGKFWGVDHDLRQALGCGVPRDPAGCFEARFDHIFHAPPARLRAVVAPPSSTGAMPNAQEPSDHQIQTALFELV